MFRISVAAIMFFAFTAAGFADSSGTSDRGGGKEQSTPAPGPVTPGATKPCGKNKSSTSDRGDGKEKTSGSSVDNPNAPVKSGDC